MVKLIISSPVLVNAVPNVLSRASTCFNYAAQVGEGLNVFNLLFLYCVLSHVYCVKSNDFGQVMALGVAITFAIMLPMTTSNIKVDRRQPCQICLGGSRLACWTICPINICLLY